METIIPGNTGISGFFFKVGKMLENGSNVGASNSCICSRQDVGFSDYSALPMMVHNMMLSVQVLSPFICS